MPHVNFMWHFFYNQNLFFPKITTETLNCPGDFFVPKKVAFKMLVFSAILSVYFFGVNFDVLYPITFKEKQL